MRENDILQKFRESLVRAGDRMQVLKMSVPLETQMEFFRYSENIGKRGEKTNIDEQIQILFSPEITEKERKFALAYLAASGEVKAYRALEAYCQALENAEVPEDAWLSMSLTQAKINLELELTDEKKVFISTGLGGEGKMLRFYAFFKSIDLQPFSDYQKKLIAQEIPYQIQKYKGILEEEKIEDVYFSILFLIDLSVDIRKMLVDAVEECNQYGNFINGGFIITNVKTFSPSEIKRELARK